MYVHVFINNVCRSASDRRCQQLQSSCDLVIRHLQSHTTDGIRVAPIHPDEVLVLKKAQ